MVLAYRKDMSIKVNQAKYFCTFKVIQTIWLWKRQTDYRGLHGKR